MYSSSGSMSGVKTSAIGTAAAATANGSCVGIRSHAARDDY